MEYDGEVFPGEITEIIEGGVKISCIEECGSVGKWPKKVDENVCPFCNIRFINLSLNELPGTSQNVEFHFVEQGNIWGDISV